MCYAYSLTTSAHIMYYLLYYSILAGLCVHSSERRLVIAWYLPDLYTTGIPKCPEPD